MKFYTESLAKNLSRKSKFGLIGTKISGILYEDLRTFDAAECNMSLSSPKYNLLLAITMIKQLTSNTSYFIVCEATCFGPYVNCKHSWDPYM